MNLIDLVARIKNKDISVWIKDNEIENRIDWIDLDVKKVSIKIKETLKNLDSYDNVILLGMGGSSLAPLVFTTIYPTTKKVFVLDTINPEELIKVDSQIQNSKNIFIVSSKSGTTLETNILKEYFENKYPKDIFIFITDEGTILDKQVKEKKLLVFNPNPNIGGRFSAFTEFGLVPAFLGGINIDQIVEEVENVKTKLIDFINTNFPEFFELSKIYQDFYYLLFEYDNNDFVLGLWLEQLIAESTGKNGKGILPVIYKNLNFDNISQDKILSKFKLIKFMDSLPMWMYVWFIYTSLASSLLKVNPFNQPDVQLSKDVTKKIVQSSSLDLNEYYIESKDIFNQILRFAEKFDNFDYIAIQVYSGYDYFDFIEKLRNELVNRLGRVVVWGFGPRYLHSVGQLYKGGYDGGVFIQLLFEPKINLGNINNYFIAQALGDLITMKNLNKKIIGIYVKT